MKIQSKITKQELVSWRNLKWLQSSKLKDLGTKGIDKLKNSLKENNFVQPFNVWQDGKGTIWILDGHHREKALKQLEAEGYEIPELLPANFVECNDRKDAAKMVLLYSSIYAKITNEGLGEFLDDFDLDIKNLMDEIDLPGLDFDTILEPETLPEDIDEAPQPLEKTYSILGDVFEIDGKHRVMCGDSTKESDVSILMNDNKADMVFTDPPYALFGNSTGVAGIVDDKMTRPFFLEIFKALQRSTKLFAHIYTCCDWHSAFSLQSMAKECGLKEKNLCIWDKGDGGLGAMYQQCYEMIWFHANSPLATRTDGKVKTGERTVNGKPNIWRYRRVSNDREHNAQKPTELIIFTVENSTNINQIVLDLFLGSGSTLIAAETTKRICYGMEIDQHYCDVILRRYKKTFPNASFKCLTRSDFPFEELFNAEQ